MSNAIKKQRMGRQKIDIKKIENKNSLQVTFSKRRSGLFKKANELCVLSGAEVAIIAFSPAKKVFSIGNPSVDSVINRYLSKISSQHTQTLEAEMPRMLGLEAEKERTEKMEEGFWWNAPIENLGLEELEKFKALLEELNEKVTIRAIEKMIASDSPSDFVDRFVS